MPRPTFQLTGGLTPEQVKLILDDVHRLLGEVGLEVDHPALLKELASHDGVTVRGNRVCFSSDLVEAARAAVPREDTNYATLKPGDGDAFRMVPPFSPFDVLDFETGERRPAEERDLVAGARLYDAFGAAGPVHVHLARMDQRVAQVHIARLCAENSRAIGNWSAAFNYEQAIAIRDMYLAAGRPEPYVAFQMTHSPLRLDAYFLDVLMRTRESEHGTRGLTAGGGAMPLPGVSAPIHWRGAAAQGLAEALGGWIAAKLIDPKIHPYASFLAWAPDMTTCMWASSAPESILFLLFNRQVMRALLGITASADCGDLARMCLHALQGCRIFECAGSRRECFSLAHVPIDAEKINFAAAVAGGIDFPGDEGLATRVVKETLPETSFLAHPTSLDFRMLYWHPKVFTGETPNRLGAMLHADSDDLLPASREIAKRKIAENPFALADDVKREVEKIYRLACETLTR